METQGGNGNFQNFCQKAVVDVVDEQGQSSCRVEKLNFEPISFLDKVSSILMWQLSYSV